MTTTKVNLQKVLSRFSEHWTPKIVGTVNDMHVKLAKFKGEFIWHHHDVEDEMFLVLDGSFTMRFREGDVELKAGDFIIVPKGVEHQPVADEECSVLLFEPRSTVNTGTIDHPLTARVLETLS
jgi:mannose-6-phosphate isomerase-like protein (cupin superfamily)